MVQIVGKYQHVSFAPNYSDYLRAMGSTDEQIKVASAMKPTVTISENGGLWTLHNKDISGKEWSSSFKLGEPFDEHTFTGTIFKSVAKREGDKFTIEAKLGDVSQTRVYEFNDAGCTAHVSSPKAGNITTSSVFKRL